MELFESHFSNLSGNLYYDQNSDSYEMFGGVSGGKHLNYLTFRELFKNMNSRRDLIILESGIASAGTQSTYLFNEYIRKYGGQFWSVDINKELVDKHSGNMCPATKLVAGDSVTFFENWVQQEKKNPDVIYLDSWDLDFYNPIPSGEHGLKEYHALKPSFKKGTLLLIDDTPANPYWLDGRGQSYQDMIIYYQNNGYMPGKGMFVIKEPKNANLLLHNYQVLYKFY